MVSKFDNKLRSKTHIEILVTNLRVFLVIAEHHIKILGNPRSAVLSKSANNPLIVSQKSSIHAHFKARSVDLYLVLN